MENKKKKVVGQSAAQPKVKQKSESKAEQKKAAPSKKIDTPKKAAEKKQIEQPKKAGVVAKPKTVEATQVKVEPKKAETNEMTDNVKKKKSRGSSMLMSVVFWTVVISGVFLLFGANVFGGQTVLPSAATAQIIGNTEVRYGDKSELKIGFNDQNVKFENTEEVVWIVDGVEVQRGFTSDSKSLVFSRQFDKVGKHVVKVKIGEYENLSTEMNIQVLKPQLVVKVNDTEKVYGEKNPSTKFSVTGFVDNETIESLHMNFQPNFDVNENSDVGAYDAKSNATHEKYDIKVVGKMKVLPKRLGVSSVKISKIYDGNDQVIDPEFSVEGLVGSDKVTLQVKEAKYVDKNVGKEKKIVAKGFNLVGDKAKNYTVEGAEVFGEIAPRRILLNGAKVSDKIFDGNNNATFRTLGNFDGIVEKDEVSIGNISANFVNPAVGENKKIVVEKCVLVGKDSKNYNISIPNNLTANILGDKNLVNTNDILGKVNA